MSGVELRHAFLRELHPREIAIDGGQLLVADGDGRTRVFLDVPSLPIIDLVSPAEQVVAAMK